MKKLLVLVLIAFSTLSYSQYSIADSLVITDSTVTETLIYNGLFGTISGFSSAAQTKVVSKYDTTILNKGSEKCSHKYANEQQPVSYISCAVYHGESGCPNDWLNRKSICTICLKHIQVVESRTVIVLKDEYTEALNKLNNK